MFVDTNRLHSDICRPIIHHRSVFANYTARHKPILNDTD